MKKLIDDLFIVIICLAIFLLSLIPIFFVVSLLHCNMGFCGEGLLVGVVAILFSFCVVFFYIYPRLVDDQRTSVSIIPIAISVVVGLVVIGPLFLLVLENNSKIESRAVNECETNTSQYVANLMKQKPEDFILVKYLGPGLIYPKGQYTPEVLKQRENLDNLVSRFRRTDKSCLFVESEKGDQPHVMFIKLGLLTSFMGIVIFLTKFLDKVMQR